jgi:hypothetical protein
MKIQKKAIITMEEKIAHLEEVLADKIKVLGIYEIIQIQFIYPLPSVPPYFP